MQLRDSRPVETFMLAEVDPGEAVDGRDGRDSRRATPGSRRGLSDGVKALLSVLFGIFLAAFIIGIRRLIQDLRAAATVGS